MAVAVGFVDKLHVTQDTGQYLLCCNFFMAIFLIFVVLAYISKFYQSDRKQFPRISNTCGSCWLPHRPVLLSSSVCLWLRTALESSQGSGPLLGP